MFETILYSVENDLATISLNRPEVSNGFNIPMCQGKIFSVGGDLS